MKKRIHILEDDHDIAYIIEYLLSDQDYEVQISSSFAELKEQLRDSIPHLFLLDVMLPDGNGIDICRDLKNDEFTRHIPVIVMSASAKGKKMSEDAGPDAYISKPFDLDEINATIKELLN